MKQISFADSGFGRHAEAGVSLADGAGGALGEGGGQSRAPLQRAATGRPPFASETLLRIHFLQQWFS